jgi:hypothetical protein
MDASANFLFVVENHALLPPREDRLSNVSTGLKFFVEPTLTREYLIPHASFMETTGPATSLKVRRTNYERVFNEARRKVRRLGGHSLWGKLKGSLCDIQSVQRRLTGWTRSRSRCISMSSDVASHLTKLNKMPIVILPYQTLVRRD